MTSNPPLPSDGPKRIFLSPRCCEAPNEGRLWCEDDVWSGECEDGNRGIEYVRADTVQSKDAEILALRGRIEAALAVINYAAERLWNGRPDAIRDRPRSRRDASMTRQTNPSLSEAVERLTHLVEMEPDDALLAGHVCDVDISDLRIILQSLSVDEEVIARARDAIADLLQALDAADSVKRGDFYHERKEARAVLDTLGMAK